MALVAAGWCRESSNKRHQPPVLPQPSGALLCGSDPTGVDCVLGRKTGASWFDRTIPRRAADFWVRLGRDGIITRLA